MADRNIADLTPEMQEKVNAWVEQMKSANIDFIITCTKRTQSEQDALYSQGRVSPGPIVTWTRHSKHTEGLAFDFCIMVNGKPDWGMNYRDLWDRAVSIGKSLGLTQVIGSNGKILEFAHLQLNTA